MCCRRRADNAADPTDLTVAAVVSALRLIDTPSLSNAVSSLSAEQGDLDVLDNFVRNFVHVRRLCRRQMDGDDSAKQLGIPYFTALHDWLVATLDVVEDFVESTPIVSVSILVMTKAYCLG
jgi:hypothetical protein